MRIRARSQILDRNAKFPPQKDGDRQVFRTINTWDRTGCLVEDPICGGETGIDVGDLACILEGLYTVYSNLPNREGLAINRKEVGLHQGASDPRPEDPLCTKWSEDYIKFPKVPVKIGYNGKVEKEPEF